MSRTDVLIVGAGPTGLVLALWLTSQGVKVRITDKDEASASTSRALAVHARTLELYQQLDIADAAVAGGHKLVATNIWSEGVLRTHVPIGDAGEGLTPYPFVHNYRQDEHERMLERKLNSLGVYVERNRELVDFVDHGSHITARVRDTKISSQEDNDQLLETYEAGFIAGCDGAHSTVRHCCRIDFAGETYPQLFYVADIEGSGLMLNGEAHASFNQSDMCLVFGYDAGKRARLSGAMDETRLKKDISELTFDDVSEQALKNLHIKPDKVNWFTPYRVHHRLADTFSKGRAFLLGDAGHIHSPIGGQGMNTGIGDAINLAWKIAAVVHGKADLPLLQTYNHERHAFAEVLLKTTDEVFTRLMDKGYIAHVLRTWIIPYVFPYMTRLGFVRRLGFSRASQIQVNYRDSPLSAGFGGQVHGGDRMPWAPVGDIDNFDSLRQITWQVHVYGDAKVEIVEWCKVQNVPLHRFAWNQKYQDVGLTQGGAYLVRPDTYIAVTEPSGLPGEFDKCLRDNRLKLT
ncbi:hypothetical protein FE257_008839 [Aspergillus nanangensis]|uniref:FAD-binding domain-containing protein n=1 Tax=Aspergillus nanangensis TaxID=2582783 RepID=A0AAD4GSA8_ASPNN|nr:hypothetical protein FE257_008839 [Aspergillus nanangensis]